MLAATPLDIVGFKVSPLGFADNADVIARAALSARGMWVLTLNLEMVARAASDSAYRALASDTDLVVADGMPIVWLSRLGVTDERIPERTSGVDLVEYLMRNFPGKMGVLGGDDPHGALRALAVDPARIVYVNGEEVHADSLNSIIAALKANQCQILFVALGVPKQDVVCRALHSACPNLVCIGVGGSFEVLAGLVPRAPVWAREFGLEWLHRLSREPRRLWRRYVLLYPRALPAIIHWVGLMRHAKKMRARQDKLEARRPRLKARSRNETSPGDSQRSDTPVRR